MCAGKSLRQCVCVADVNAGFCASDNGIVVLRLVIMTEFTYGKDSCWIVTLALSYCMPITYTDNSDRTGLGAELI